MWGSKRIWYGQSNENSPLTVPIHSEYLPACFWIHSVQAYLLMMARLANVLDIKDERKVEKNENFPLTDAVCFEVACRITVLPAISFCLPDWFLTQFPISMVKTTLLGSLKKETTTTTPKRFGDFFLSEISHKIDNRRILWYFRIERRLRQSKMPRTDKNFTLSKLKLDEQVMSQAEFFPNRARSISFCLWYVTRAKYSNQLIE